MASLHRPADEFYAPLNNGDSVQNTKYSTRRVCIGALISLAGVALMVVASFGSPQAVPAQSNGELLEPTSVAAANQLLENPTRIAHDELYERLSPHFASMYKHFLKEYGSTAPGNRDFTFRLEVFKESMKDIIKLNSKQWDATFGITPYCDWTQDEKATQAGAVPPAEENVTEIDSEPELLCTSSSNCDYWKGLGYCTDSRYSSYMHSYCACACQSSSTCANSLSTKDCKLFAQVGFCKPGQKYYSFVIKNCPASCGTCGGHGGGSTDVLSRNWAATYPRAFEVRNQGGCGSCWAHSTAELLRQMYTVKHLGGGALAETGALSVQFLVDCVSPFNSHSRTCGNEGVGGCCGGWPSVALQWIHQNGGMPTQKAYGAYHGGSSERMKWHTCRHVPNIVTTTGPKMLKTELAIRTNIVREGTVGIAIHANNAWFRFTGGALPASACLGNPNHAVQLVGYDHSKGVWIVQNSWGTNWGVQRSPPYAHVQGGSGFILLKYGENACNIQYGAVAPLGVSKVGAETEIMLEPPAPVDEEIIEPAALVKIAESMV